MIKHCQSMSILCRFQNHPCGVRNNFSHIICERLVHVDDWLLYSLESNNGPFWTELQLHTVVPHTLGACLKPMSYVHRTWWFFGSSWISTTWIKTPGQSQSLNYGLYSWRKANTLNKPARNIATSLWYPPRVASPGVDQEMWVRQVCVRWHRQIFLDSEPQGGLGMSWDSISQPAEDRKVVFWTKQLTSRTIMIQIQTINSHQINIMWFQNSWLIWHKLTWIWHK